MSPSGTQMPNRPEAPPLPRLPWHERLNVMNVSFIIFLLAVIYSGISLQGSGREMDYLGNLWSFLNRFFPPDLSIMERTLSSLLETVEIAVMATFFAILLSFIISIGAAQNISPRWIVWTVRMILNGIRTIPSLIWALLAVAVVGPNSVAGVIALTFYSIGYLGKFYSEAFESVDIEVARGLRAIGADPVQAFQFGLWPHAKPLIWSYSLWMLEYNIRSAAIIGYVGAGGIGLQLHTYASYNQWQKFCTVLLCILVVVTVLDLLGGTIRRRIVKRFSPEPLTQMSD